MSPCETTTALAAPSAVKPAASAATDAALEVLVLVVVALDAAAASVLATEVEDVASAETGVVTGVVGVVQLPCNAA